MTPSRYDATFDPPPAGPAESIGALLARVRLSSGRSQLRLAELLCAASGVATVTRHEISRWEREERIPSGYWLRWLAAVLDVPLDGLERASAVARGRRGVVAETAGPVAEWRSPGRSTGQPAGAPQAAGTPVAGTPVGPLADGAPGAARAVREVAARIHALRRMDDLVGGGDLAGVVDQELRAALDQVRACPPSRDRRALLALIAELAQLAGWVAADAGLPVTAGRAHQIGIRAADAVDDAPLAGHLLACLAHLGSTQDPAGAAELARRGYARARSTASATTRSLLLHRVAFTAARAGDRRGCERGLARAEQMFDRRDPGRDPSWVYWFDDVEFRAMTGRCYAALRRPRLAEPLLRSSLDSGRIRLRPWALYAGWLAAAHLDAGEVEQACGVAGQALLTAVRVGSVRALHQVLALHPRLATVGTVPAVKEYADLLRSVRPYLPGADTPPPDLGTRLTGCR